MSTIMRNINMISRCEGIYRTDNLKDTKLCSCHHSYVLAVCRHPGMTQEQLAKHFCINKSSVTRSLSHLEENGYVERRPDPKDKRILCVYPTQKMLDILPEVKRIAADWNEYLVEGIEENDIALFRSVLEKLAARAQMYISEKEDGEK